MEEKIRTIRQISARTGLGLKFISKDMFLSSIIKELESILDRMCVLKGGTAISRAGYLEAPRFSEDVDIDCYTNEGIKKLGKVYEPIFAKLENFDVETPRFQGSCLRFDAFFNNHFGEKDRIRIELAPRAGPPPDESIAPKTILQSMFSPGPASLLRTYARDELFAMKIDALSGRLDGKDPFDLWGMHNKGVSLDKARQRLNASGREGKSTQENALKNIEKMIENPNRIANTTNHYIPRTHRPDWKILLLDVERMLERM